MSLTISGRLRMEIELRQLLQQGLRQGAVPTKILRDLDLKAGTADGKIDKGYYVQETGKAASTEFTYDLAGGSITDLAGTVITFAEVCCIFLANRRETALAWLKVGPAASAGFGAIASNKGFWAGTSPLNVLGPGPDSFLCLYDRAGVPVTPTTADSLGITTSGVSGSDNAWDLVILGRSA